MPAVPGSLSLSLSISLSLSLHRGSWIAWCDLTQVWLQSPALRGPLVGCVQNVQAAYGGESQILLLSKKEASWVTTGCRNTDPERGPRRGHEGDSHLRQVLKVNVRFFAVGDETQGLDPTVGGRCQRAGAEVKARRSIGFRGGKWR